MDYNEFLPNEIWSAIFTNVCYVMISEYHLIVSRAYKLRLVCKRWNDIILYDTELWRQISRTVFNNNNILGKHGQLDDPLSLQRILFGPTFNKVSTSNINRLYYWNDCIGYPKYHTISDQIIFMKPNTRANNNDNDYESQPSKKQKRTSSTLTTTTTNENASVTGVNHSIVFEYSNTQTETILNNSTYLIRVYTDNTINDVYIPYKIDVYCSESILTNSDSKLVPNYTLVFSHIKYNHACLDEVIHSTYLHNNYLVVGFSNYCSLAYSIYYYIIELDKLQKAEPGVYLGALFSKAQFNMTNTYTLSFAGNYIVAYQKRPRKDIYREIEVLDILNPTYLLGKETILNKIPIPCYEYITTVKNDNLIIHHHDLLTGTGTGTGTGIRNETTLYCYDLNQKVNIWSFCNNTYFYRVQYAGYCQERSTDNQEIKHEYILAKPLSDKSNIKLIHTRTGLCVKEFTHNAAFFSTQMIHLPGLTYYPDCKRIKLDKRN